MRSISSSSTAGRIEVTWSAYTVRRPRHRSPVHRARSESTAGRATAKAENFVPYVGAFVGGSDVQKKELTILFNEQNVVIRHSMRDGTEEVRRNLSSSSSPKPSAGQIDTSPAPQPGSASAVAEAPAPAPASPPASRPPRTPRPTTTATAAPLEAGNWTCGIKNPNNASKPFYTLQFVVAADHAITVVSYANASATVVSNNPLTFTAVNPNGSRLTTFSWRPDNSLVVTGPGVSNPNAHFFNEGTCTRTYA
jgi:hypothetical protein